MTQIVHAREVRLPQAKGFMNLVVQEGPVQVVHMLAEPNAVLPMHSHEHAARMVVIEGEAIYCTDKNNPDNGKVLTPGVGVDTPAREVHGYKAGPQGFKAISINREILGRSRDKDDINWRV